MHCFLMLPRLQWQKVANRLSMLEIYLYLFSPASFPDPAAGTYHSDINILLEQSLLKPLQVFQGQLCFYSYRYLPECMFGGITQSQNQKKSKTHFFHKKMSVAQTLPKVIGLACFFKQFLFFGIFPLINDSVLSTYPIIYCKNA